MSQLFFCLLQSSVSSLFCCYESQIEPATAIRSSSPGSGQLIFRPVDSYLHYGFSVSGSQNGGRDAVWVMVVYGENSVVLSRKHLTGEKRRTWKKVSLVSEPVM